MSGRKGGVAFGGSGDDVLHSGTPGGGTAGHVAGSAVTAQMHSQLFGGDGDDTFYAEHSTYMQGSSGADRYVIDETALHDGALHVIASGSDDDGDTLVFAGLVLQKTADAEGRIRLNLPEGFAIAHDAPSGEIHITYGRGVVRIEAAHQPDYAEFAGEKLPFAALLQMAEGGILYAGGAGDDEIRIQPGDAFAFGGSGADTYTLASGFSDVVISAGGSDTGEDTLAFADLPAEAVRFYTAGADLLIRGGMTGGTVTVAGFFQNGSGGVKRIIFADNTVLDKNAVTARLSGATEEGDYLRAPDRGGKMSGLGGDDVLLGSGGDDVLEGGAGNDRLAGGHGDNRYVFAGDFGQDRLESLGSRAQDLPAGLENPEIKELYRFASAATPSLRETIELPEDTLDTLRFVRSGKDLLVMRAGSDNHITLVGFDHIGADKYRFVFADKQKFAAADIVKEYLSSSGENDRLHASARNHFRVEGLGGHDELLGSAQADFLDGGDGNDRISDGKGDDTVIGGTGNDHLFAGDGNNTFLFGKNLGKDVLMPQAAQAGAQNTVRFTDALVQEDFVFRRYGDDLLLTTRTGDDSLKIERHFAEREVPGSYITALHFSDGTEISEEAIALLISQGSDADDVMHGVAGVPLLGLGGNDYLTGSRGNDVIDGGTGNDRLAGGAGVDTYVFSGDFGQDTIHETRSYHQNEENILSFGEGWRPEDFGYALVSNMAVYEQHKVNMLIMRSHDGRASVMLDNFFGTQGSAYQKMVFADGREVTPAQIHEHLFSGDEENNTLHAHYYGSTLNGHGAHDRLYGNHGRDVLIGGAGQDFLRGGGGQDIYFFGRDFGADIIDNRGSANDGDMVQFGEGLSAGDFMFTRMGMEEGDNLTIIDKSNSANRITIYGYFSQDAKRGGYVSQIQFADGSKWTSADVEKRMLQSSGGNDELYALPQGSILQGLGGDDRLVGHHGNDRLEGGTGNDTLTGGGGDDVFVFAKGFGQGVITRVYGKTAETDTLHFEDLLPADISLDYDGYHLLITQRGSDNTILVENHSANTARRIISTVSFLPIAAHGALTA